MKNLLIIIKTIIIMTFKDNMAPHLIHKDIWNKVGGFSENFIQQGSI